jgi:glycosyltransferase involved in cell wall biosynthesis
VLKKLKQVPFYFEVRDLWPEAPVQLRYIRNKYLIRLLYAFEKYIYCQADKIITLSPGMKQAILRHQLPGTIALIPNMADTRYFTVQSPPRSHFHEPFIISYIGAIGRANRLDFLLKIALACQEQNLTQVQFFIAGQGAEAEPLQAKTRALNLTNVRWLGQLNREQVRNQLATSHATYTSFDTQPVLATNSPNKFFDSLAAGKLTLVNTKGWLAELVEQHACGFYADPHQPQEFVQKLRPYLENPALLRQAQQQARTLAEKQFSRQALTQQFISLFQ